jgi:hypothetical protein
MVSQERGAGSWGDWETGRQKDACVQTFYPLPSTLYPLPPTLTLALKNLQVRQCPLITDGIAL